MGGSLPRESNQFLQLYVYVVSALHAARPDTIFAVYSYDERPRKTAGTRYDLEEGVRRFGLGIFPDGLD